MMQNRILSGSKFEAEIGYARAVVSGPWIFVSGTTGYDYTTGAISPSIIEQTEQTLKNIEAALEEAGARMHDVVRVNYILVDRNEFPLVLPTLRKTFGDVRPAATMIQAVLLEDEMKIEIEVTARKGDSTD